MSLNTWNIKDYNTEEKATKKLKELKELFEDKSDSMPSTWCENVQSHIEELEEFLNKKKTVKNIIKESRLPKDERDPEFGVPSQKKYPLFDKPHVLSAIKLFGHVEPRFEAQLAHAIIAKMRKYDIPYDTVGEDNRLYKYIPKKFLNKE